MEDYGRLWKTMEDMEDMAGLWLLYRHQIRYNGWVPPNYLRWSFGGPNEDPGQQCRPQRAQKAALPLGSQPLNHRPNNMMIQEHPWDIESHLLQPNSSKLVKLTVSTQGENQNCLPISVSRIWDSVSRTRARESSGPKSWKGRRCTTSAAGQQWIWKGGKQPDHAVPMWNTGWNW